MTILDWSWRDGVQHWGGGTLRTCRSCETPTLLVVVVRPKFVSRLCNTTVAPTTTAPAESRTVPFTAAVA